MARLKSISSSRVGGEYASPDRCLSLEEEIDLLADEWFSLIVDQSTCNDER
jgi:hypothetical protein